MNLVHLNYVFRCIRWNIEAHLPCIEHITGIVARINTNGKQAEAITKTKLLDTYLTLTFGIQGEQDLLSISAHLSHQNADITTCMKIPPKRKEQRFASGFSPLSENLTEIQIVKEQI